MNGLSINRSEFEKMPTKQQLTILYENTETLKEMIRGYKFSQKIQFAWLGMLTVALGIGKYLNLL